MPTAKVTKNVSAAIGGGNVLCSTLISIKTKAWLYSFRIKNVEHYESKSNYQVTIQLSQHQTVYQSPNYSASKQIGRSTFF